MYSQGSVEEVQIALGPSYDAWFDIPGSLAIIKTMYDGHGANDT